MYPITKKAVVYTTVNGVGIEEHSEKTEPEVWRCTISVSGLTGSGNKAIYPTVITSPGDKLYMGVITLGADATNTKALIPAEQSKAKFNMDLLLQDNPNIDVQCSDGVTATVLNSNIIFEMSKSNTSVSITFSEQS